MIAAEFLAVMTAVGVLLVLYFIGCIVWKESIVPKRNRKWILQQPSVSDADFLNDCGLKENSEYAELALVVRSTISELYHVPYEKIVPSLLWKDIKPRKHIWSIVDYWKYMEMITEKFGRKFEFRDSDFLLFPYEGIAPRTTIRDFVNSLIDIFDRYEHLSNYLPSSGPVRVNVTPEETVHHLKSRYVLLQGATPQIRQLAVQQAIAAFATEKYTICRFPAAIKTKQDFWDVMHSFAPMGPRYEVDGQSGLDMEVDYFERREAIANRPDNLLLLWEDVSPDTVMKILGFILEDYYEMAYLRKPEKIRYLITLNRSISELPEIKLTNSDDSLNSYCPNSAASLNLPRRVMVLCDLTDTGTEAKNEA